MHDENTLQNNVQKKYITEKEVQSLKNLFIKNLKSYKDKDKSTTDEEWLKTLFKNEFPKLSYEEINKNSEEIISSINTFNKNLKEINIAAKKGISKERWLSKKIQESSIGVSINEYGKTLKSIDDVLYQKNIELAEALKRSSDGNIKMSPNLDGNIAENLIANTAELSGILQDKNIKVEVRDVFTENSVDVRAINLDTGKYQNYQLKFGKNADATIDLIERGNYNNQQIIVPKEQLKDVQQYFKEKGSSKTISDHIEVWGAKGKSFTKEDVKEIQKIAQEKNITPQMDYSSFENRDVAMSIGKNAGVLALQSAAVTTGLTVVNKVLNNESIEPDEMVEIAIKTGADTSIKVVTAGTLQVAIRKGIISIIPKSTPAGIIANIACVGIENVKILTKIASGEISMTKGLDQMGRVTVSMIGGLATALKGAAIGAQLTAWVPVIGIPLAAVTGLVGGMVGYFAGSKIGETVYNTGKKVAGVAKSIGKSAIEGIKSVGRAVGNTISKGIGAVCSIFR